MRNFLQFRTRIFIWAWILMSIFIGAAYAEDSGKAFPAQFSLANLSGKNGFAINGSMSAYGSGIFVSGGGDVNGDDIPDVLICAINGNNNNIFTVYVVFGSKKPWSESIRLDDLNGVNGFAINGVQDSQGISAVSAGDINGDRIDDILIGAPGANNEIGQCYIVFGSRGPWEQSMNLIDLNGKNGFTINGINPRDFSGVFISGAGDVSGDGIDDILIGAPGANNDAGQSYVVFGNKQPWPIAMNLEDLDGTNGFTINGINSNDFSGTSVSIVGDINVDGVDDMLIGASFFNNYRGQSYIVFGSKNLWPSAIDLGALNGTNGFAINGINPNDLSGFEVAKSGDVNGDGIPDFLIASVTTGDFIHRGQVYLIYGSRKPWPALFRLADLNGKNGFIISGIIGAPGFSVRGAVDVNCDGLDDILIGATPTSVGQSYVIFGNNETRSVEINVANLNGKNGFTINGISSGDYSGSSVSGVGDFNGDRIDDFLIGAYGANNEIGQSYVIFGEHEYGILDEN